jgi:hypothetical protein
MGRALSRLAARVTRTIIFAKAPVAGAVKTRLIPALGAEGAAALARQMLHRTCEQALAANIGPVELCVSPDAAHPDWNGHVPPGVEITRQGDGDLGERLWRAVQRWGAPLMLIGTDCPDLDARRLRAAAAMLASHDAMIHPTADGGYALLGLNRFDPSLFADIKWSSATVAQDSIARIEALGWSLHIGETLRDIDEPEDLVGLGSAPPFSVTPAKAGVSGPEVTAVSTRPRP